MSSKSRTSIKNLILETQGRFFSVLFKTRSGNGLRFMNCKLNKDGLEKSLKNNLISVYDITKKGYRNIPIEGIISVVINNTYTKAKL